MNKTGQEHGALGGDTSLGTLALEECDPFRKEKMK
jgi:hypothetical protein